jgi:hypothetical protein
LKSLQNFVKKFEKGLNGFDFKRFDLKEVEKKKKREKNLTSLSARSAHRPINSLPQQPSSHLFFFFFPVLLTGRFHLLVLLLPPPSFPLLKPAPIGTRLAPRLLRFPLPSVGFNQEP